MGLDLVELVMRVEEDFGIEISDAEAEEATTVGALHRLVIKKLDPGDLKACITSAAFYRTRKALMETMGAPRSRIRPTTELGSLFSEVDRVRQWVAFTRASTLTIPDLETGWFLRGNIFPVVTVGDLVRKVEAMNEAKLKAECGGWTEWEIWEKLRRIVADELGIDLAKVTAEARFLDDLGAD